nr:interleukin 1 receptor associated kinase 2 [Andrias davidianus]
MAAPPPLLEVPPRVLEEFCRLMDCLTDSDWMRFASHVISSQTELRKLKCLEKTGVSVTRELMWSWGQRLATVQDLLVLLQKLEFYRARDVILNWYMTSCSWGLHGGDSSDDTRIGKALATPARNEHQPKENVPSGCNAPDSTSPELTPGDLPGPPPPPESLLRSLRSSCDSDLLSVKLEDAQCSSLRAMQMFFGAEVDICSRCCHANILKLLGHCTEDGFPCLVYQHMPNGSLESALEPREGAVPLTWQNRVAVCLGLLQAVRHLHDVRILHGNIKSSNVLLDEDFTPKLGHAGVRFYHTADYTRMKTKMLNVYQAYLPEEFIRSGQLTEEVDIFGCGIVLAEVLTGMKAMAGDRQTLYLKDVFLEEMERAKERLHSKGKPVSASAASLLPARGIVAKYLQGGAGHLPEEAALLFASAVYMCLRKKKAPMAEIYAAMEKVELQRQCPRRLKPEHVPVSRKEMLSLNYPEETDDDSFLSEYSASGGPSPQTTGVAALQHQMVITQRSRIPCESDESDVFSAIAGEGSRSSFLPVSGSVSPDSSSSPVAQGEVEASRLQAMGRHDCVVESETCSSQGTAKSTSPDECPSVSSTSNSEEREAAKPETTSMGAEVNKAKEKMLQKIALFQEGQIDSAELFSL